MPRTLCWLLLFLPGAAAAGPSAPAVSPSVTGGNAYVVTIDEGATRAHVDARLFLPSKSLAMFGVQSAATLSNGQADLIRNLEVRAADGRKLAMKDLGEGDYEVDGQGEVKVSYDVLLEHDKHAWSAGLEEVAFHTADGVMITGYSLLLAPGDGMQGDIDIRFELPEGWKAFTPWLATASNTFSVPNRRELLSNALFFGTGNAQTLDIGGVQVTLLLGREHRQASPLFVELLTRQMLGYQALFGGKPLSSRYLILVNQGFDDGGAFASSFSQFIDGPADAEGRLGWGFVMSHELLHFWNGLSLVPTDAREEWFKEGFTDYLTVVTQSRAGLVDEARLNWRLENLVRRNLIARVGQRLGMTMREAGKDKQPNRELIYGGGALVALALDVELRKATGDKAGLPEFLQSLYAEFGVPGKTYSLADIERHAIKVSGRDFHDFFQQTVESKEYFDVRPWLKELGLKSNTWLYDEAYVRRDPLATPAQLARHRAIFGARVR